MIWLAAAMLAGSLQSAPLPRGCQAAPTSWRARDLRVPRAADARRHRVRVRRTRAVSAARAARCFRLHVLLQREALLHDFLVRARTETPRLRDERAYRLDVGVTLGPAEVTTDFIGSPIVRARVTNVRASAVSFLLSVRLVSSSGATSGASTVVFLHGYETQTIELLCPDALVPQTMTWSTMPL
jgi:hypothetical protein